MHAIPHCNPRIILECSEWNWTVINKKNCWWEMSIFLVALNMHMFTVHLASLSTQVCRISATANLDIQVSDLFPRLLSPSSHARSHGLKKQHVSIHVEHTYIYIYTLRIQVCPKKEISPTILFWGWDWDHQSYSREGSGFLGIYIYTYTQLYTYLVYESVH